jgi:hypothetical protein
MGETRSAFLHLYTSMRVRTRTCTRTCTCKPTRISGLRLITHLTCIQDKVRFPSYFSRIDVRSHKDAACIAASSGGALYLYLPEAEGFRASQFNLEGEVLSLAFTAMGNVVVAFRNADQLCVLDVLDRQGQKLYEYSDSTYPLTQGVGDICVGADGYIYACDTANHRVLVLAENLDVIRMIDSLTSKAGQVNLTACSLICVLSEGQMVAVDTNGNNSYPTHFLHLFTVQGMHERTFECSVPGKKINIAAVTGTRDGHILVLDSISSRIIAFTAQGTRVRVFGGPSESYGECPKKVKYNSGEIQCAPSVDQSHVRSTVHHDLDLASTIWLSFDHVHGLLYVCLDRKGKQVVRLGYLE